MRFFTPQKINDIFTVLINGANRLFGKLFPAILCVRVAFAGLNSKNCIQHENTLFTPWSEITVNKMFLRHLEVDILIILQRFIDIDQAWWHFCAFGNAKAHTHSFIVFNIWILAHNYNSDVLEISLLIRVENQISWWVTDASRILTFHKFEEEFKFWRRSDGFQWLEPRWANRWFERRKRFEWIFDLSARYFNVLRFFRYFLFFLSFILVQFLLFIWRIYSMSVDFR